MPLDLDCLKLVVYEDAGFANADGKKSQLDYVIVATSFKLNQVGEVASLANFAY